MVEHSQSMQYRERAADMHRRASQEKNGDLRASYLVLARDWLKLADNEAKAEISVTT